MLKIRHGKMIELNDLCITPVEKMVIAAHKYQNGLMFHIEYEPLGVIVVTPERRWALDICGASIDPKEFYL